MKLRSFLFGSGRRRGYLPAMNQPQRWNKPEDNGEDGERKNPHTDMGTPCNPPSREKNGKNEACTPYGKLLPDAQRYMKNVYDKGNEPYLFRMRDAGRDSDAFREALWTGEYMQAVRMNVPAGEDIGKEIHQDTDQLITVTDGRAEVLIGRSEDRLSSMGEMRSGDSVIIPAGYWHNLINRSGIPLRLISVYSPPHHPYGIRQEKKS